MRFGLFGGPLHPPGGPSDDALAYDRYIDYVLAAEGLGFHGAYLVEHHFSGFGQVSQPLTLLSHLAARTRRIRLGTAVIVLPWHNPVLLAEQAATVDLLSGGRLDFGIGRGYRHSEYTGFDLDPGQLGDRFDEAIALMRRAWTSRERFSHHGRYWSFSDIVVEPAPVQRPQPPLWMAAASPGSIRKAAGAGFNLLLDQIGSFALTAQRIDIFRAACHEAGRPFEPDEVAVARTLHIVGTAAEREAAIAGRAAAFARLNEVSLSPAARDGAVDLTTRLSPPGSGDPGSDAEAAAILGSPDECIERLQRLQEMGTGRVLLIDFAQSPETLATCAREIRPAFQREEVGAGD